ncbi:MAG TPA: redoxin domain-containing protein [Gammaproteobacteria bacterium]|nr:redoxin domain-containing protein [Gammaproteobacteria bacterium]
MTVKPGRKIPNFAPPATGDKDISQSNFKNKNAVLYFYPRDSACAFSAMNFTYLSTKRKTHHNE